MASHIRDGGVLKRIRQDVYFWKLLTFCVKGTTLHLIAELPAEPDLSMKPHVIRHQTFGK